MSQYLTRRGLLTGASSLALTAPALLRAAAAQAQAAPTALVMPALFEGTLQNGRQVFDLNVAAGETRFFKDAATRTIGINQSYLGPILRIASGTPLRMNVTNGIDEEMTLHWHGLHLPGRADGGPHQAVAPGTTWSPEFDMLQKAGTFWFHGHQMHKTGAHVWAGMAGVIRVEDAESAALDLPASHGEDDFTLVLQDRRFTTDGQMPYAPSMHDQMAGMAGDVALVNGVINPYLEVPAGRVRLRVLNGSNGSFYNLHFADGRQFWQIATDGGLLAAPVPMSAALLGPAERAEFIVDFDSGAATQLLADVFGAEVQMMGGRGTVQFLDLRPTGPARATGALPDRLADLAPPTPAASSTTRHFSLEMTGRGMAGSFAINGQQMDPSRIDFEVPLGATETWVIVNTTVMFHPFHIHDVQFRILTRNGAAPAAHEAGLKDTVVLAPQERVEVQLSFTKFADPKAPYMYHCHILEHEDAGMMGQFVVV